LRSFYYHFFKSFWLTDAKFKMHANFAKSFFGRGAWECAGKTL
jgi:hypothetical protein